MGMLPPSLPGVNMAEGLKRLAGNEKLFIKLLRHLAGDVPAMREKFSNAIMEGDAGTVKEIAHSLKGAAANLSVTSVAAAAEQLEMAARAEDFSQAIVCLEELEQSLEEFLATAATLPEV